MTAAHGPECKCTCTPRACLHVEGRIQAPCTCTPGWLAPRAESVTDALGWQATTTSRRFAALIAETTAGTISLRQKGEWEVHIPQAVLAVTVMNADTAALQCALSIHPHPQIFILVFVPWPATTVLKFPLTSLPARGMLSARDVRMTTRMGRIVRYLIPEIKPP